MQVFLKKLWKNFSNFKKNRLILLFGVSLFSILFIISGTISTNSLHTLNDAQDIEPINTEYAKLSGSRSNGDRYSNISFAFFYNPDCPCTYDAMAELKIVENEAFILTKKSMLRSKHLILQISQDKYTFFAL